MEGKNFWLAFWSSAIPFALRPAILVAFTNSRSPNKLTFSLPEGEFQAYIFDCDGTIADSMPLHYIAWRNALALWNCDFGLCRRLQKRKARSRALSARRCTTRS